MIARQCATRFVAMVAYIYIADNGTYGMRRLIKDLLLCGIGDFKGVTNDWFGGDCSCLWILRLMRFEFLLAACVVAMIGRWKRGCGEWCLICSFCLEWFLWMCFGVDCGLCVGCFPDLWCCAETPSFPALGNTCVFSRFDDPACALSRTSKYQIWVYRCARRHTFLRHISMNQLNMSLLIYYDRSVATCRPRS